MSVRHHRIIQSGRLCGGIDAATFVEILPKSKEKNINKNNFCSSKLFFSQDVSFLSIWWQLKQVRKYICVNLQKTQLKWIRKSLEKGGKDPLLNPRRIFSGNVQSALTRTIPRPSNVWCVAWVKGRRPGSPESTQTTWPSRSSKPFFLSSLRSLAEATESPQPRPQPRERPGSPGRVVRARRRTITPSSGSPGPRRSSRSWRTSTRAALRCTRSRWTRWWCRSRSTGRRRRMRRSSPPERDPAAGSLSTRPRMATTRTRQRRIVTSFTFVCSCCFYFFLIMK